ncbi:hypothetical protein H2248_003639 [Termitomyces sp. 'cryptogamus']|nr:hypothetical protein H2248_003639 [Termitomyces sp. 'cryptogamus']
MLTTQSLSRLLSLTFPERTGKWVCCFPSFCHLCLACASSLEILAPQDQLLGLSILGVIYSIQSAMRCTRILDFEFPQFLFYRESQDIMRDEVGPSKGLSVV